MAMQERPEPGARALPLTAMAVALGVYAGLVAATVAMTGGAFEYPLDDPYIHLALAEQIAHGTYGINPGEVASPGSSPLYPLLLTPVADSALQRYLPALWNVAALAVSAWAWGRLLFEAGYGRAGWRGYGYAAAAVGPVALLMPQIAFLGMEHELHAAAALVVVLGLYRHLAGERPGGPALVVVGALLGSAFRFEGMALGLFAGAALYFTGARRAGALAVVFAFLPIVLFAGFLASLGLDPAPSSVQVKLAADTVPEMNPVENLLIAVGRRATSPGGLLVTSFSLALLAMSNFSAGVRGTRLRALALAVATAGAAHLVAGRFGWFHRYEHYAVVVTAAALVALLPRTVTRPAPGVAVAAILAAVIAAPLYVYQPGGTLALPRSARAIHVQQGQMAGFAQAVLAAPVAVNDIGRVAWHNPNYVLDLWGLASEEARNLRLGGSEIDWTGQLTSEHDVPVAMIYKSWFDDDVSPGWVWVGDLDLTIPTEYLGSRTVAFYATSPDHVDMLRERLAAWVPTLAPGSRFIWAEGMQP